MRRVGTISLVPHRFMAGVITYAPTTTKIHNICIDGVFLKLVGITSEKAFEVFVILGFEVFRPQLLVQDAEETVH